MAVVRLYDTSSSLCSMDGYAWLTNPAKLTNSTRNKDETKRFFKKLDPKKLDPQKNWFPKDWMRRQCAPFVLPLRWLRTCLKVVWVVGKFLVKTEHRGIFQLL